MIAIGTITGAHVGSKVEVAVGVIHEVYDGEIGSIEGWNIDDIL